MIGSRCDGNLDGFLWAIFSLYNPKKEKNGIGKKKGYIWKFDNVETQNKHEVSLGSCLLKIPSFFWENIGLDPWAGFYHG